MPIIWRFLLGRYFKVFCLSLFSFIAVLLITRLDEIAQFATLGAPLALVCIFTFYQILYILPIAIPISSLISSILLYINLSRSHELTALRSSGMGLKYIIMPILLASLLLTSLNFYIVSEWATRSHLFSKQMINELKSINPLLLLQNKQLVKLKEAYVDISSLYGGELARDVIIVINNRNTRRLNLMNAKTLKLSKSILFGNNVSFISSLESDDLRSFDHLVIENQNHTSTLAGDFSMLLKTNGWRLNNDHLQLRLLLVKAKMKMEELAHLRKNVVEASKIKHASRELNRCFSEISRRFSSSIAVLTFTLMGTAFGIDISRVHSKRGSLTVISLASFFLCMFFAARNFEPYFFLATAFYLLPHLIIVILSFRTLRNVNKGIE